MCELQVPPNDSSSKYKGNLSQIHKNMTCSTHRISFRTSILYTCTQECIGWQENCMRLKHIYPAFNQTEKISASQISCLWTLWIPGKRSLIIRALIFGVQSKGTDVYPSGRRPSHHKAGMTQWADNNVWLVKDLSLIQHKAATIQWWSTKGLIWQILTLMECFYASCRMWVWNAWYTGV